MMAYLVYRNLYIFLPAEKKTKGLAKMMRKMLFTKRHSRDVGELMKDAHIFYNEANKGGLDSDDEDNNTFVSRRPNLADSQKLWQQQSSRRRKKNKIDEVRFLKIVKGKIF